MKTFQKIILASAISAAPFASQAMEALDDSVLGNTTGQAGVTIELSIGDAGISVGEIEYTDTAHDVSGVSTDGGSVVMQNLSIKNITKLTQTIDVHADGHLQLGMTGDSTLGYKQVNAAGELEARTTMHSNGAVVEGDNSTETLLTTPVDAANMTAGEVTAENAARLAAGAGNGVAGIQIALGSADGSKSAVLLQGTNGKQAELVNHLNVNMDLGDSTTTIYNMSNMGTLGSVIGAGQTYSDATPSLAISMEESFRINDLDVGMFGYTQAQAVAKTTTLDTGVEGNDATAIATANGIIAKYNAKTSSSVANVTSGVALSDAQKGAITGAISTGSAVEIENLSFVGSDGGLVEVDQTIWADSSAVYMQIGAIKGDLNIHAIKIGGNSIGSVRVSDINLAGLTQKIYGH